MRLVLIALLALASYRITRFIILDTLIETQRVWVLMKLWGEAPSATRQKLHELLVCSRCLSVWVSAAVVAITSIWISIPLPFLTWLGVCGAVLAIWRIVED